MATKKEQIKGYRASIGYSGDDKGMIAYISTYRKAARSRKIEFSVSGDEISAAATSNCSYCGIPPSERTTKRSDGNIVHTVFVNGIDRIDNSLGYIKGNITSCCTTCNTAKMAMSVSEFLSWIKRVYTHNNMD